MFKFALAVLLVASVYSADPVNITVGAEMTFSYGN